MRSRLRRDGRMLVERLGPVRFRFALHAQDGELWWRVNGVKLFGVLPLPASLFDGVYCREGEAEGRYTFEVEAALPLCGRLIRYEGWLEHAESSRTAEHTSELQSLMRISYAVFCLTKKKQQTRTHN